MPRLIVVGNPNNLDGDLRQALNEDRNSAQPLANISGYVFLLSKQEEEDPAIGDENAKYLIARDLSNQGIHPNGNDVVLMVGNSVLFMNACYVIQERTGGHPPARIVPYGKGFKIHRGPIGGAEETRTFIPLGAKYRTRIR